MSQGSLIVRQRGQEYSVPDLATLQTWVSEGRVLPDGTVFDERSNQWVPLRDFLGVPESVKDLARNYRAVVIWVGLQILLFVWYRLAGPLAILAGPLLIVSVIALVYYPYQTAKALGSSSPVLWAVAMFVPCVNLLTLLALSSRASAVCRAHGIRVGLLGPEV